MPRTNHSGRAATKSAAQPEKARPRRRANGRPVDFTSVVSHHLKELRNAGVIQCEKRGQWVYCAPDEEVLKEIAEFIEE